MDIRVTFDSSSNHPHLKRVREVLRKEGDSSRYTDIDGLYYIEDVKGVRVRLNELLGGLPPVLKQISVLQVQIDETGVLPGPRMGYYRLARAEGWVKSASSSIWGKADPQAWVLDVVAPSFDEAKQLYIEMRHSRAQPARGWGSEDNAPAGDLSPLDTLSPYASTEHKTNLAIQHMKRLLDRGEISMSDIVQRLTESSL